MTSWDYVTDFGWLKWSESSPVHSDFTYKHNLTFIRLPEHCDTEFRGRLVCVSYVFINHHHSVKLEESSPNQKWNKEHM